VALELLHDRRLAAAAASRFGGIGSNELFLAGRLDGASASVRSPTPMTVDTRRGNR